MSCWSCQAPVPAGAPTCPACRRLQPPPGSLDAFRTLGLSRGPRPEVAAVEAAFRERARLFHPDRHGGRPAGDPERRHAQDHTARLHQARRTLLEPLRRAGHLLALAGQGGAAGAEPAAPTPELDGQDFLEEQLRRREALHLARSAGEREVLETEAAGSRARLDAAAEEVLELLTPWPPPPPALRAAAALLRRTRYEESLLADAEAGLADPAGLPGGQS